MGDKIKRGLKKSKKKIIVAVILWIILSIVFVAPMTISIKDAMSGEKFDWTVFFTTVGNQVTKPFSSLAISFTSDYFGTFFDILWKFTIAYVIILTVGIVKAIPKNEYSDIEHGSSDWSEGEEYKVLSKNKGIILAEKEYLPVDKRGNVNVLVVGRLRFW